jgi:hypothetical protein
MSGDLNITFARDMPAASVEVVAPDMQVVERVMLDAGRSRSVTVPSEGSFLRVHLPSGQVVTLHDPGNLSRVVSMQTILQQSAAGTRAGPGELVQERTASEECMEDLLSLSEVARYHTRRTHSAPRLATRTDALPLSSFGSARLLAPDGTSLPGTSLSGGKEAQWQPNGNPQQPPLALRVERSEAPMLTIAVPGDIQRAWVRADLVREQNALTVSIRLTTSEPTADTILGYLQRGDLYSAEAMTEWIEEAEELLLYKKNDPYAATVGAYLLLRLKRFDNLHDWAKNLADRFPFLPDGSIIWAWQMIQQQTSDHGEIRKYLLQGAERGLPIYTDGLRLLLDGLRLLGSEGQAARDQLLERAGVIIWDSPLAATLSGEQPQVVPTDDRPVVFDIAFAAAA